MEQQLTRMQRLSELAAIFAEASRLRDEGRLRAAIPFLERGAKSGDPAAQMMLGYCYDNGSGIVRSRERALFWYRKAAAAGDPAAAANLGSVFLAAGRKAVAMRWFRRAVTLGLPEALLDIAQLQGGPSAAGRAAQATLRRLLRHRRIVPAVRETALDLLSKRNSPSKLPR